MQCTPSDEQKAILAAIDTHNVIVDAVPGSGKTTSILFILEKYADSESILVLTYNSRLRHETRDKVRQMGFIMEPDIHTFHSFCYNKWEESACQTDKGIIKVLALPPKHNVKYSMVIVDESQDLTALYMNVVKLTLQRDTKLVMLGDKNQSIYQFNDADNRFLQYAAELNKNSARPYVKLSLSVSYRLSQPVVNFLNECVLHKNRIRCNPNKITEDYVAPVYLIDNFNDAAFRGVEKIANIITDFIAQGYKFDDIFILAPSLKGQRSKCGESSILNYTRKDFCDSGKVGEIWRKYGSRPNPITKLALFLTWKIALEYNGRGGIFIPSSDDAAIKNEDIENKIVFCTYHKAKGLERKIVIVFGFDESYFVYYAKDADPNECPNTLYVALTRSMNKLIICHSSTKKTVNFLDTDKLQQYATVRGSFRSDCSPTRLGETADYAVTYLLQHIRTRYMLRFMEYITCVKRYGPSERIKLPDRKKNMDTQEVVYDVNGNFITDLLAIFCANSPRTKEYAAALNGVTTIDINNPYSDLYQNAVIEKLLERATWITCNNSGYYYKTVQIKRFNWLKSEHVLKLMTRMNNIIKPHTELQFEMPVRHRLRIKQTEVKIEGRVDIIDHKRSAVWEIKCAEILTESHFLQLALYKYLHMVNGLYADYKYFLFNVKNCEIWRVDVSLESGARLLKKLCKLKLGMLIEQTQTDEEFVQHYSFYLDE